MSDEQQGQPSAGPTNAEPEEHVVFKSDNYKNWTRSDIAPTKCYNDFRTSPDNPAISCWGFDPSIEGATPFTVLHGIHVARLATTGGEVLAARSATPKATLLLHAVSMWVLAARGGAARSRIGVVFLPRRAYQSLTIVDDPDVHLMPAFNDAHRCIKFEERERAVDELRAQGQLQHHVFAKPELLPPLQAARDGGLVAEEFQKDVDELLRAA